MKKSKLSLTGYPQTVSRLTLCFFMSVVLILLTGVLSPAFGQWEKTVIDDSLNSPWSVFIADVDGDNDLDVVSCAWYSGVAWYENPSWSKHYIDAILTGSSDVVSADIDGDNDADVVAGSRDGLFLYENDGMSPPNWTKRPIRTGLGGAMRIDVADMDNDNDLDVVGVWFGERITEWYENTEAGWTSHPISSNTDLPVNVSCGDINGDDTTDVTITTFDGNEVIWYEAPDWTPHVIFDEATGYAFGLQVVDIDADNDSDVVASVPHLALLENNGEASPAWTLYRIDAERDTAAHVSVGDIDKDNVLDIVTGHWDKTEVVWYKKEGSVWSRNLIADDLVGAEVVAVADIDGDSDLDVVATGNAPGSDSDAVVLYRNPFPTGVEDNRIALPSAYSLHQNYPNPFNPNTTINYVLPMSSHVELSIYNILGKKVSTIVNEKKHAGENIVQFDASNLPGGIYFYKITAGEFNQSRKMILLK